MEKSPLTVHHKGRRFTRSSARASSAAKDGPHKVLPPPTPPSGKDRGSINIHTSKEPFPYQRFKPLPSIGSTLQAQVSGEEEKDVVSADSAVDLTSPSPVASSTEIRGSIVAQALTKETDRKHLHGSRGSSRDGRSAAKTAKIDAKPPVSWSTAQATGEDNLETSRGRRATRGYSKSKSKARGKRSVGSDQCQQLNIELPPEPAKEAIKNETIPPEPPKDAPNTVTLKVRLLDGECMQRRFNYKSSTLRDIVHCAQLAMESAEDKTLTEKRLILSNNCVPKVVFSELSLTLEEAGLVHNTLLHLDCEDK